MGIGGSYKEASNSVLLCVHYWMLQKAVTHQRTNGQGSVTREADKNPFIMIFNKPRMVHFCTNAKLNFTAFHKFKAEGLKTPWLLLFYDLVAVYIIFFSVDWFGQKFGFTLTADGTFLYHRPKLKIFFCTRIAIFCSNFVVKKELIFL